MDHINWRDLMAWPLSVDDRAVVERLRRKEEAGHDLTPDEVRQAEAIWRNARPKVRDEAAERRLKPAKTADELFAELDKL